ncbi:MAG: universal stress protein [Candidatus Obscuribacterales bacterium]|nr:universal stress protein [Candidatus Obscuribacterales bacterium]
MKVLVALDDSDCSARAVDFIIERPWQKDDQLLVLSVVEPVPQDCGVGAFPPPNGSIEARCYDESAKVCGDSAAKIQNAVPDLKVEVQVASGFAAETICKTAESWNADLVVLGSHGRKGIAHLLLGSVAEEVLRKSSCSVEVINLKQTG